MSDRVPREIIALGSGEHTFRPADYPWLTSIRVCLRGGDASDGAREDGYCLIELYDEETTSCES